MPELYYLFFLIIFYYISKRKIPNILNPVVLFIFLWTIIVFLASLQLFGLNKASQNALYLIFVGCTVFFITSLAYIYYRTISTKKDLEFRTFDRNITLRYRFIYLMAIFCIGYYLKDFINSFIFLINGGNFNNLRLLAQNQTETTSLNNFVKNFIVLPFSSVLEVVAAVDFWFGRRDRKLLLMTFIVIFMRVISDAGRTPLVNFAIYLFIGYFLIKNAGKKISIFKSVKAKRIFKRFLLIFVVLLAFVTFSRTTSTVMRQIYFYFSMSPVLLSNWLSQIDTPNNLTYGVTSLNGFLFTFEYILRNIFGFDNIFPIIQEAYSFIAKTDSMWLVIAQGGIKANAYVSAFLFMYLDGKIFGVIIGMVLYATLVMKYYVDTIKKPNMQIISIYLLLYQGLFFSFIRFPFVKPYYAIAFALLLFLFRKDGVQEKLKFIR